MSTDFKPEYLGYNFIWFFGVVEDRNDPLKLGRVRVRCYSWHTNNKEKLPTSSLPWAQCIQSVTSAANSGVGQSPTGLLEGSWVMGFFLDGEDAQKPMIMGSLAGIPTAVADTKVGFNDPSGTYPTLINEPDVDRLARNDADFIPPLLATKESSRTSSVPTSTGATWNEEASKYNASYPKNHVIKTESGHVFEIDDTPGHERIHEYHKSGTFREISATGNTVTRIVGDNYEIIAGSDYVNIKGSSNITIDSNCTTYVKGNWDVQVDGKFTLNAKGESKIDLQGSGSTIISDTIGLTTHTHTDPAGVAGAETSAGNDSQ